MRVPSYTSPACCCRRSAAADTFRTLLFFVFKKIYIYIYILRNYYKNQREKERSQRQQPQQPSPARRHPHRSSRIHSRSTSQKRVWYCLTARSYSRRNLSCTWNKDKTHQFISRAHSHLQYVLGIHPRVHTRAPRVRAHHLFVKMCSNTEVEILSSTPPSPFSSSSSSYPLPVLISKVQIRQEKEFKDNCIGPEAAAVGIFRCHVHQHRRASLHQGAEEIL